MAEEPSFVMSVARGVGESMARVNGLNNAKTIKEKPASVILKTMMKQWKCISLTVISRVQSKIHCW